MGNRGISSPIETTIKNEFLSIPTQLFSNSPEKEEQVGQNNTIKYKGFEITTYDDNSVISIQKPPFDSTPLYLKVYDTTDRLYLLYSFTDEQGTFEEYSNLTSYNNHDQQLEPSDSIIARESGITKEDFKLIFGSVSGKTIASYIVNKFNIDPIETSDVKTLHRYTKKNKTAIETYGWGMKTENIPETTHLGDLVIFPKKLYYDNKLVVKNSKMMSVAGLKNIIVSDNFVKLMMNILSKSSPTNQEINKLSTTERHLYDRLITLARLHKIMPHQSDRTIEELKHRLKLIEGEIEIGNNSPLLLKEIYTILHSLKDLKKITQKQVEEYLSQFEG